MTTTARIETAMDAARSAEAESAWLAACMLLGDNRSRPALSECDFTDLGRRSIWRAMQHLARQRQPIDPTLLVGALRELGLYGDPLDGPQFVDARSIIHLFDLMPFAKYRDRYAVAIREQTKRRAALEREAQQRRRRTDSERWKRSSLQRKR